MTYFTLPSFSQTLLVVGLVSAGAEALPIRCFAACNQPMSTVEESQCAQAAADRAYQTMQISLNRALVDAGKMIGNGNTVDYRPQISESQGIWEKWKEAQCKLEADLTMGSAGAYVLPQCRERLIIDRTKSLDDIDKQLKSLL
jgi:Lysozyme inhibitor LprI